MKKRRLNPALPVILLFCANHVDAQTATKPVAPEGQLLAQAPDPSTWVISVTYPADRLKDSIKAAVHHPSSTTTTTKTGKIIHEETVGSQGNEFDSWHLGRNVYDKWTGAPAWSQEPANTVSTAEFKGLDWVSKNNYVGSLNYSGHRCLVFIQDDSGELNVESPGFEMDQFDKFHTIAFIDAKSRLPVETRAFGLNSSYVFSDGPADKLTLPSDLVAQLKKDQGILSRLSGHVSP